MIIDILLGTLLFLSLLIAAILSTSAYGFPTNSIAIDVYGLLKLLSLRAIAWF